MNRAVLLLLLTLAAFAGAVAYLHHRALAPRPKSPAELSLEKRLPRVARAYDLSAFLDELCAGTQPLISSMPLPREQGRRHFVRRVAEDTGSNQGLATVGDRLLLLGTPRAHRVTWNRLMHLSQAPEWSPQPALLQALDRQVTPAPGRMPLQKAIAAVLPADLPYRVDWAALARAGVQSDTTTVILSGKEPVAMKLVILLSRQAPWRASAPLQLSFGFAEGCLVIGLGEQFQPTRRRYPLAGMSKMQVEQLARELSRSHGYIFIDYGEPFILGDQLVVIGDEFAHARVR